MKRVGTAPSAYFGDALSAATPYLRNRELCVREVQGPPGRGEGLEDELGDAEDGCGRAEAVEEQVPWVIVWVGRFCGGSSAAEQL